MQKQRPAVELLKSKTLTTFPSASAIEYNDKKLFVFGDDASYLLVLDTNYNVLDTVHYLADTNYRISKSTKADIESATIIPYNNERHLYALGSFSTDRRMKLFSFSLADIHSPVEIDLSAFSKSLKALSEINIEGMAFAQSKLVMVNRANKTHKLNKLIVAGNILVKDQNSPPPTIIDIELNSEKVIGISGLYYAEEDDILFFCASEEDTPNALEDGAIGDSYIGWFSNFSQKMVGKQIKADEMINLTSVDKIFTKQKIESLCMEKRTGDDFIFYLAADNDNGSSSMFKIGIREGY